MTLKREYRNEAVFFSIFDTPDGLVYCSGVNIERFLPITRGRHKSMSNPAIRGLQLVNLEIRSIALGEGAETETGRFGECSGLTPPDEFWYTESLLIKNAPDGFSDRVIEYAVVNLLKKIDKAIMLNAGMPEKLLPPESLMEFINELCRRFG